MTNAQGDHLETEQKYDVEAGFARPGFGGLTGPGGRRAEPRRYYLSATYYDTENLGLHRNRITLRRRVGGSDEGWHLKLPVRKDTRQELHAPLDEGGTGSVPARLTARVEDITAGQSLRPIAILDTERTVVTVPGPTGEPMLEVADDRVTATRLGDPDEEPVTWREIEVEVISEAPEAAGLLEEVGQALRKAGAKPSSSGSKLARLLQSLFIADPDEQDILMACAENLGGESSRRGHTKHRFDHEVRKDYGEQQPGCGTGRRHRARHHRRCGQWCNRRRGDQRSQRRHPARRRHPGTRARRRRRAQPGRTAGQRAAL